MTDLLIYSSVWFILVINFLKTNSYIFVQYFFSAMKYGLLFWLLIFVYNDFIKNSENILMNSLCGMKNLINACYMNSSFQILIHIPQFIKIVQRYTNFEGKVIYEINKIYKEIIEKY